MSISDADRDTSGIELVGPIPPEIQHAARKIVCAASANQPNPIADAEMLFDMLGIRPAPAEERKGGCPVCGKALPLFALSPKCGLKGTCSKQCKAVLYRGEGARS
jgi:hypothetical protein